MIPFSLSSRSTVLPAPSTFWAMFLSANMAPDHQLTTNWSSLSPAQNTLTDFHVFWNSLPAIDLNQPLPTVISELKQFFWNHFIANYDPFKTCTLHYPCPCYKCSVSHSYQLLSTQCIHLMVAYIYSDSWLLALSLMDPQFTLSLSVLCNPFHAPIWTVKQ